MPHANAGHVKSWHDGSLHVKTLHSFNILFNAVSLQTVVNKWFTVMPFSLLVVKNPFSLRFSFNVKIDIKSLFIKALLSFFREGMGYNLTIMRSPLRNVVKTGFRSRVKTFSLFLKPFMIYTPQRPSYQGFHCLAPDLALNRPGDLPISSSLRNGSRSV